LTGGVIGKVATDRAEETDVRRLGDDCGPKAVLILAGEVDKFGGDEDICAAEELDVTVRGAKGAGFELVPSATPCPYELPRISGCGRSGASERTEYIDGGRVKE